MGFIGGDVIEVVCKHPELGDFRFFPKANEAFTLDPGGFRSNDDASAITGSGEMIDQINRVRWSLEGPIAVDLVGTNEMEGLPALAAHPLPGVWTMTHISGRISKGTGKPVGDLQQDTNAATMTLKVSGGGKLEKI
jgi:hypothetical protein